MIRAGDCITRIVFVPDEDKLFFKKDSIKIKISLNFFMLSGLKF